MPQRRIRFTRQVLALQLGVTTLVLAVAFGIAGWMLDRELTDQFGQRALAVARTVAQDPGVLAAAARVDPVTGRHDPDGVVQARAEAIRGAVGALFVVVTDRDGIRLSHPDPANIGRPVSTDPREALAGRDVVTAERGTLGLSVRGKVPLRDPAGQVIGIVSVGFDANDIQSYWLRLLLLATPFVAGALLLGVVGAALQTRRLRRLTLGLEPHELAELVQEREAVLHCVGEGVLATDAGGRVTVCNDEAGRLLGIAPTLGADVGELDLPAGIRPVLADERDANNLITIVGDRVLVVNRREVRRGRRDLGRVLTLRDRSDLEALTNELDAVKALTEGLRAQRHEFSNRLHTIAGMLQTGHVAEALDYLHTLDAPTLTGLAPLADVVRDPCLQALLGAKAAVAAEKGVRLRIGEESWVAQRITAPVEVTTVLGNLVENAIEAARLGTTRPAWVEVILAAEGPALHAYVADSGEGVSEPVRDRLFVPGVSTRDGDGRGLGLALARQAATGLGGEVRLADACGAGHGAVFTTYLPSVLGAEVEGGS